MDTPVIKEDLQNYEARCLFASEISRDTYKKLEIVTRGDLVWYEIILKKGGLTYSAIDPAIAVNIYNTGDTRGALDT